MEHVTAEQNAKSADPWFRFTDPDGTPLVMRRSSIAGVTMMRNEQTSATCFAIVTPHGAVMPVAQSAIELCGMLGIPTGGLDAAKRSAGPVIAGVLDPRAASGLRTRNN